jgi:transposase-like protein
LQLVMIGPSRWESNFHLIFTPQLSGQWHVDEMAINVRGGKPSTIGEKGQWKWLWTVMDKGTRFQLAAEISQT